MLVFIHQHGDPVWVGWWMTSDSRCCGLGFFLWGFKNLQDRILWVEEFHSKLVKCPRKAALQKTNLTFWHLHFEFKQFLMRVCNICLTSELNHWFSFKWLETEIRKKVKGYFYSVGAFLVRWKSQAQSWDFTHFCGVKFTTLTSLFSCLLEWMMNKLQCIHPLPSCGYWLVCLRPVIDIKRFQIEPHYDLKVTDLCLEQTRDKVVYLFNEPSKS